MTDAMTASDTQAATNDGAAETEFLYPVTIEDAGVATKKVTVQIPESRISESLATQFKELRSQASIPGFRPGHVPQKLIEKRFTKDVREQVTRTLLQESYQQAVEKNKLQVLGEPDFENADAIKLPDAGDMSYSFQVEVQPEFVIPDLTSLVVKRPAVKISDEHVQQALTNLREQQGTLLPVEDRGIKINDVVTADVHLKVAGEVVMHQHDQQFKVQPTTLAGVKVDDLPAVLDGAKVGDEKTATIAVPEGNPNEKIAGKEVAVEFKIKDVREQELAEINDEFLDQLGFKNQDELLAALREEMELRVKNDVQNAMRDQVAKALLEGTNIDLPAKMSSQQEGRIVQRRAVDLMQRGVPEAQIVQNIEVLRGGAKDEAIRELKLFFILQRVAEEQNVDVNEGELNGNIAAMAEQRGLRPEKLKQQMSSEGSLQTLYLRLRELKAIDKILEHAKIEDASTEEKKDA